jgi:hypothetical protein
MPEYHLIPRVVPLGVILFDFLFLLVAIPVEAYVLNRRLKFDKKSSAFYGITVNLFSSVIGWLVFFFAEPLLPVRFKSELIDYLLFNQLKYAYHIQTFIILTAFIIFFATFVVKYLLLRILLISLSETGKSPQANLPPIRRNSRRNTKTKWQNTNLVTTLLIANSLSYTLIIVIFFIRSAYV